MQQVSINVHWSYCYTTLINSSTVWSILPSKLHSENENIKDKQEQVVESLFLNARMTSLSDKGKVWPEVICPGGLVQCSRHPLTSRPDCQGSVMKLPTSFLRYKIFPNFSLLHVNYPQTSLNIILFCSFPEMTDSEVVTCLYNGKISFPLFISSMILIYDTR